MTSVAAVIAQQLRRLAIVGYQHIDIAIVVVVAERGGATDTVFREIRAQ